MKPYVVGNSNRPAVVAVWTKQGKKKFVEEQLLFSYILYNHYIIQISEGNIIHSGRVFSPREMSKRIYYQLISRSEAETWLKEHLSETLYKECLNEWPFTEPN